MRSEVAGGGESVAGPLPISTAEAAIAAPLLYARIDLALRADGTPQGMELELMEPSLYFTYGAEALERFVQGVRRRL
jgi:hypothetical protein